MRQSSGKKPPIVPHTEFDGLLNQPLLFLNIITHQKEIAKGQARPRVISPCPNPSAMTDYDSEEESLGSAGEEAVVQLGFLEAYSGHLESNRWGDWDGGKVGGRPVWLNRSQLPPPARLRCRVCSDPLTFLLQIYCPLDDPPQAFHRSLYLFCCRRPDCFSAGSVLCLRGQLPRENPFFSSDPDLRPENVSEASARLCEVCGCGADSVCSRCKSTHYCSRRHQKEDWARHKSQCGLEGARQEAVAKLSSGSSTSVFPEFAIVVDAEELKDTAEDEQIARAVAGANIWEDALTEETDEDASLRQSDYSKALGNEVVDPAYVQFMTRVRKGGDQQVLRYCRWEESSRGGGPLYMHSAGAVVERKGVRLPTRIAAQDVPRCSRCGGERKYEFQVSLFGSIEPVSFADNASTPALSESG